MCPLEGGPNPHCVPLSWTQRPAWCGRSLAGTPGTEGPHEGSGSRLAAPHFLILMPHCFVYDSQYPPLWKFFQFSSVAQSCLTLCNPMDCSTPGLPVHHQLLELAQTHVRRCHPTISSSVVPFSCCLQSFPASGSFSMSQFFTSGCQILSALLMNIQD